MFRAFSFGYSEINIQSGTYYFDFIDKTGQVVFYRVERYCDSHQGLWRRFFDLLDILSANAIRKDSYDNNCIIKNPIDSSYPESVFSHLPQIDAIEIVKRIESLRKIMNKRGNNNWLSTVRNSLNYNHEYGTWFPYNNCNIDYDILKNCDTWCFRQPMDSCFENYSKNVLIEFVQCCQLINSITFEVVDDLIIRHPCNGSFLNNTFNTYRLLYKKK